MWDRSKRSIDSRGSGRSIVTLVARVRALRVAMGTFPRRVWARAESLYEQTLAHASHYRQVVRVDAARDISSTAERVRDALRASSRDFD